MKTTSKLTLSIDPAVVARARRYAKGRGTSISRLVENYLAAMTPRESEVVEESATPVLRQLTGVLAGTKENNRAAYRRHLAAKFLKKK